MGWVPAGHDENHASRHADGGADELDAADLGSGAATDGQVLTADGVGGAAWEDATGGGSSVGAHAETIGDGSTTSFAVTHSLGTEDVVVQLWDLTGTDPVEATADAASIEATDTNTVTVTFSVAPALDSYRVVILSSGGSGGGGVGGVSPYVIEPGLKPPDTPNGDDDEFDDANGTDPTTTGWSWGNQDSTTAETRGGLLRIDLSSATTEEVHGLFKAVPATGDVTVASRIGGNMSVDFDGVGLCFLWGTLATPTDLEYVRILHASTVNPPYPLIWSNNSSYATFVTNRGSTKNWGVAPRPYVRLVWDDTASTVRGYWTDRVTSNDDWVPLAAAVSKASRPDFMGIIGQNSSTAATYPVVWADFFRVNWTPDFDPTV